MWKKTKPLEVEQFTPQELFRKAYVKAVNLLYAQPYTQAKLKYKLIKVGYPGEIVEEVIQKLIGEKFINDDYYCQRRLVAYLQRQENSLREIKAKLQNRGFPSSSITLAFEEILGDYPDYEYQAACKLLQGKFRSGLEDNYQKALAYLARKGFGASDAHAAIKALMK